MNVKLSVNKCHADQVIAVLKIPDVNLEENVQIINSEVLDT